MIEALVLAAPEHLACVAKHLLLQLENLSVNRNQLVGSLPKTWSRLINVSYINRANLLLIVHARV